ncbi:MAG: HEAT repeat domain-containing protein [Anaerolineae bacterium]|nr:HEAT repeat domain-containing protein [Anaerolineae bacterium]
MTRLLEAPDPGNEPRLGGSLAASLLSGFEPLLGGVRRASVDPARFYTLLDTSDEAAIRPILVSMERLGQTETYIQELARAVSPGARHNSRHWNGAFSSAQRRRAISLLTRFGSYESLIPLIEALSDTHYDVCKDAETALSAICERFDPADRRTRIVYHALVDALRVLPLAARKVAARLLVSGPADLVLKPVLAYGLRAEEWWARREAVWVLGTMGDIRATRRLMDCLLDPSDVVRATAAWALGRLDAPVAIKALVRASEEQDERVRGAALEALGAYATRPSSDEGHLRLIIDRLIAALADPDAGVRIAALEILSGLSIPQARIALQRLLRERGGTAL